MWSDVHEPEKYGIYQSVGDTMGLISGEENLSLNPLIQEVQSTQGL